MIYITSCCRTLHTFHHRQSDPIWIQIPGLHFRCLLYHWNSIEVVVVVATSTIFCNSRQRHRTWAISVLVNWIRSSRLCVLAVFETLCGIGQLFKMYIHNWHSVSEWFIYLSMPNILLPNLYWYEIYAILGYNKRDPTHN